MEKGLTQLDYDHIDMIIKDAERQYVKELVHQWVTTYMQHPKVNCNLLLAYKMAYSTIIKNKNERGY